MNRKIFGAGVLAVGAMATMPALAQVSSGIGVGSFAGAHVERFDLGVDISPVTYNFANGLSYENLDGNGDRISLGPGVFYGLGNGAMITTGFDDTRYFGVSAPPTRIAFSFAGGVNHFGFYGAESDQIGEMFGLPSNDAQLTLEFYSMANVLLDTLIVATPSAVHAWSQFHGFHSNTLIGRVEFVDNGHMVLDNMMFAQTTPVPEPQAWLLALAALGVLAGVRRKTGSGARRLGAQGLIT
ncbi:MAG: hypothetical protein JNJ71_11795 [Rubrivivax sp.]|nr:hypothetical protein [Rubrivivax sp.]